MTIHAHIMTTRVVDNYGSFRITPSQNDTPEADLIDIWFVTVSKNLSDKSESEIKDLLDIRDYGVWITTPYKNHFWIVQNFEDDFNVQEIASADFSNYYTQYEVDDLIDEINDDRDLFLDSLANALRLN